MHDRTDERKARCCMYFTDKFVNFKVIELLTQLKIYITSLDFEDTGLKFYMQA